MARKFVDLEEAAQILGVTPDTLSEMRDRREVHGYRDGSSWKFKQEDIERVKADRDAAREEGEFAELDEDPDSILLSEVELGASGESTSSTIIGGKSGKASSPDSDIQLAQPKHDSNVDLDAPLVIEDAASGSDVLTTGSGVSPMFDDLDNLDLEMPSAADSGISSKIISPEAGGSAAISDPGSSDITLGSDALQLEGSALSFGDDEPMSLGDEGSLQLEDAKSGGSDIDLMGDIDDDLVLGGSSHGDLSRWRQWHLVVGPCRQRPLLGISPAAIGRLGRGIAGTGRGRRPADGRGAGSQGSSGQETGRGQEASGGD